MIDAVFEEIAQSYRAKTKLSFLSDLEGQIYDDDEIRELLEDPQRDVRQVVVTFDRRRNDNKFSYSHADLLLVVLDRICGGGGIRKPLSQVRVITARWTRSELLKILRYFSRNNREIRFRRILILRYADRVIGYNLDPSVYLK